MLRELRVSQVPGEPHRRWFAGDGIDLMVWSSPEGTIVGIQLCYETGNDGEHALTWVKDRELSHMRIDDGENRPGRYKMTPILVADGAFDAEELLRIFEPASRGLDAAISSAVRDVIGRYARAGKPVQPTPKVGG